MKPIEVRSISDNEMTALAELYRRTKMVRVRTRVQMILLAIEERMKAPKIARIVPNPVFPRANRLETPSGKQSTDSSCGDGIRHNPVWECSSQSGFRYGQFDKLHGSPFLGVHDKRSRRLG